MSFEDDLTAATQSLDAAAQAYHGKIGEIDARVAAKEAEVDAFVANARTDLTYMHEWQITVEGDEDKFYPVLVKQDFARFNNIEIVRGYSEARGQAGLMAVHARFVGTGGSWGGNACILVPEIYAYRYQPAMARWGQVAHRYYAAFWLRGGGYQYRVRSSNRNSGTTVYLTRTQIYDNPNDIYNWWVEPLEAVDADMLPNDFGLSGGRGDVANQA